MGTLPTWIYQVQAIYVKCKYIYKQYTYVHIHTYTHTYIYTKHTHIYTYTRVSTYQYISYEVRFVKTNCLTSFILDQSKY